jgi:hypothetical protein
VCRSTERPKRKAERLNRVPKEAGYEVRLQKCLELVAQMYGYANYHELPYSVDSITCSPDDEAIDETPKATGRKPAEGDKRQFLTTMAPEVIKSIKLAAIEDGHAGFRDPGESCKGVAGATSFAGELVINRATEGEGRPQSASGMLFGLLVVIHRSQFRCNALDIPHPHRNVGKVFIKTLDRGQQPHLVQQIK